MEKWGFAFISILCLFVLASCGPNKKSEDDTPKMLNVNMSILPEKGKVNNPVTFKAEVTMGLEKVNDADEVAFEIWRAKDVKHDKIQIKHSKNGVYRLSKIFQQEGTYYIISHVTAMGMHNMPKKEFIIGKPSQSEEPNNSMNEMKMKDENKQ